MELPRREPSHPMTGWVFVTLGCLGLAANLAIYFWRCSAESVAPWPIQGQSLQVLAGIVREALPAAILLVLGVLIPLQRLGSVVERRDLLSRTITAALLLVAGGYWILRLNTAGFASLWARQEPLGDLMLPAALLENRVWSANIMVIFVVAVLSLPLNTLVRRLLSLEGVRRAPWPLWLVGAAWWVGLAAVLLLAGGV